MTPDLIEKMARALCELRIREIRRFDRTPEEIERQLSASVDYAWGGWVPEATTALSVALDAIGEECARVAGEVIVQARMGEIDNDLRSIYHIQADEIRARIAELKRALPLTK